MAIAPASPESIARAAATPATHSPNHVPQALCSFSYQNHNTSYPKYDFFIREKSFSIVRQKTHKFPTHKVEAGEQSPGSIDVAGGNATPQGPPAPREQIPTLLNHVSHARCGGLGNPPLDIKTSQKRTPRQNISARFATWTCTSAPLHCALTSGARYFGVPRRILTALRQGRQRQSGQSQNLGNMTKHEHIRGLDVAVHYLARMQRSQSRSDAVHDQRARLGRKLPPEAARKAEQPALFPKTDEESVEPAQDHGAALDECSEAGDESLGPPTNAAGNRVSESRSHALMANSTPISPSDLLLRLPSTSLTLETSPMN
ncbi:hypothetical protein B0T26DRAFT_675792 [Lasiosphaeria miniovina]|uniref:Uncharacterized protein n=1 Tax=Lasiosphaeria miniovina TaxID=1954250 RepID=A0AA40AKI6_9PEZI|nr:uncharacterized protein B0T26DRAFT_675792 [Lasiosphaeria miniovina]KAK0717494.1 hypothetical protein B0T26DRAFT_675792 [Lasiosphaeria miniovina]